MEQKQKYEWRWGELGFWQDVKHLGSIALNRITVQPLASHGDHFKDHLSDITHVEVETHPGQLFEGDEPTVEMDLNEINAHMWENYDHPFDHQPDKDAR